MTLVQVKGLKKSIRDYKRAIKNSPAGRDYHQGCIKKIKTFIHDIITENNKLNQACHTHKYFGKKLDFSDAICDISYKNIGFKKKLCI